MPDQPTSWDEDRSHYTWGANITDAAQAAAAPTKAEFDALVAKFNSLLAAVRAAGIIQSD